VRGSPVVVVVECAAALVVVVEPTLFWGMVDRTLSIGVSVRGSGVVVVVSVRGSGVVEVVVGQITRQ